MKTEPTQCGQGLPLPRFVVPLLEMQERAKTARSIAEQRGDKSHVAYENGIIDAIAEMRKAVEVPTCKVCEFEEGWGNPFCRVCGSIFDSTPILQKIREYVAGVNDDCDEDEERDQVLAMIDALIQHNDSSANT